ncbi:MAG: hypothetical protein R2716_04615 [Microthrixaceae bacterium]
MTHNYTEAAQRVAAVISHALGTGATRVEATEEAEQAWVEQLDVEGAGFIGNATAPRLLQQRGSPAGPLRAAQRAARYPQGLVVPSST